MDKWKIIVVVLLLGALGGYGWMQQNAAQTSTPDAPIVAPEGQMPPPVTPTPPSNPKLNRLSGTVPPAWNIEKKLWANTAAPISLASLKGSPAIVEFWRIGCSHCRDAAPFLNALYQKNKPRGLKMVAIQSPGLPDDPLGAANPENNWEIVQQAMKQLGITYPVAFDEGGFLFKRTYGGDTYPTTLILDRNSKVQAIFTGHTPAIEIQLVAALEKVLKK